MQSGKSDSLYYVRYRARVTGPYALGELSRMVRRGTLGRAHEISRDRVQWQMAGAVSGLFDADQRPSDATITDLPPGPPASAEGMYYRENGATIGPLPPADLQALLRAGKLPPQTIVWSAGDPAGCPASAHPLLTDASAADADAADGHSEAGSSKGCALVLIVVAAILLAGGVWAAIHLSSTSDKDSSKPATMPSAPVAKPDRPATPARSSQGRGKARKN